MLRSYKLLIAALSCVAILLGSGCQKDEPQPNEPEPADETPVASYTYENVGQEVEFTFTGSNATAYEWDFGDGTSSTEESPSHTYTRFGTYQVELRALNGGNVAVAQEDVEVHDEAIAAIPELDLPEYDGAFYAINHQRDWLVNGVEKQVRTGAARAWCKAVINYVDVGNVTFKQSSYTGTMIKNTDNSYDWMEDSDEQVGFNRSGGPAWSMEGGSGHPFFNGLANSWPFPKVNPITWVVSAGSAQVTAGSSEADTMLFALNGPNGTVVKGTTPPNGVVFTSADFDEAGKGLGVVTATAYKLYDQTLGDNTYLVVNATSSQTKVTLD